eukprot:CAMPEP_0203816756 /NCGR_PEP_ID=MMETSP0115-20131106/18144_1 /ASSEMBLY_ACC=CAM_ASM_000227 /TAXON_ID=33651 /ORGANISM="Bicosoecid sp, Strain ms1" /LENGTH=263 /DNA_ID=CAMNT_0050725667 /DNA_START=57 /DNA_END=846 /DNA_ORIENTATION=-
MAYAAHHRPCPSSDDVERLRRTSPPLLCGASSQLERVHHLHRALLLVRVALARARAPPPALLLYNTTPTATATTTRVVVVVVAVIRAIVTQLDKRRAAGVLDLLARRARHEHHGHRGRGHDVGDHVEEPRVHEPIDAVGDDGLHARQRPPEEADRPQQKADAARDGHDGDLAIRCAHERRRLPDAGEARAQRPAMVHEHGRVQQRRQRDGDDARVVHRLVLRRAALQDLAGDDERKREQQSAALPTAHTASSVTAAAARRHAR